MDDDDEDDDYMDMVIIIIIIDGRWMIIIKTLVIRPSKNKRRCEDKDCLS